MQAQHTKITSISDETFNDPDLSMSNRMLQVSNDLAAYMQMYSWTFRGLARATGVSDKTLRNVVANRWSSSTAESKAGCFTYKRKCWPRTCRKLLKLPRIPLRLKKNLEDLEDWEGRVLIPSMVFCATCRSEDQSAEVQGKL